MKCCGASHCIFSQSDLDCDKALLCSGAIAAIVISGAIFLVLILSAVLLVTLFVYGYKRPESSLGQFMIKV